MTPSLVITLLLLTTSYVDALRMTMMQTAKTLPSVGIIGGGPAGLSAAIMLARRGYSDIKVFERLPEPLGPDSPLWVDFTQERSYNIGISGRGQRALRALDLMPAIEKRSADVVGRMDWAPETPLATPREVIYTGKSYVTKVIQRDRLASILLHELRTNPAYSSKITVAFDTACTQVDFLPGDAATGAAQSCRLHLAPTHLTASAADTVPGSSSSSSSIPGSFTLTAGMALGCDGTNSALREAMAAASQGRLSVRRYEDKNVRVYRTIPLHFSPKQRTDLNWSARTKSDVNLDALPTKGGPMLGEGLLVVSVSVCVWVCVCVLSWPRHASVTHWCLAQSRPHIPVCFTRHSHDMHNSQYNIYTHTRIHAYTYTHPCTHTYLYNQPLTLT